MSAQPQPQDVPERHVAAAREQSRPECDAAAAAATAQSQQSSVTAPTPVPATEQTNGSVNGAQTEGTVSPAAKPDLKLSAEQLANLRLQFHALRMVPSTTYVRNCRRGAW